MILYILGSIGPWQIITLLMILALISLPVFLVVFLFKRAKKVKRNKTDTRQCPFCGEEILAAANKCKHCGEWLEKKLQPQNKILTRKEIVAVCKTCKNHKTNIQKGIVCGLTNEQANFQTTCPDYAGDKKMIEEAEKAEHAQKTMTRRTAISAIYTIIIFLIIAFFRGFFRKNKRLERQRSEEMRREMRREIRRR